MIFFLCKAYVQSTLILLLLIVRCTALEYFQIKQVSCLYILTGSIHVAVRNRECCF